jgi:hypothetical protein
VDFFVAAFRGGSVPDGFLRGAGFFVAFRSATI